MSRLTWKKHNCKEFPGGPNTLVYIFMRADDAREHAVNRGSSPAYRLRWEYIDRGDGPYPSGGDIMEYAIDREG